MILSWLGLTKPIIYRSKINGTITIGTNKKNTALFSGGVTQSGGEITLMWEKVIKKVYCHPEFILRYTQDPELVEWISGSHKMPKTSFAQDLRRAKRVRHDNILLLGVGGGSVIHAIRRYDKQAMITGIELDPVMKEVAQKQFGIKEDKKQKIIIADAIAWTKKQSRISRLVYGTIIVDLYIGPLNPDKSRTKVFFMQLKKLVKPHGIILYNAHYQKKNIGEYEAFRKIIDKTFENVEEVFTYPLNKVLLLK